MGKRKVLTVYSLLFIVMGVFISFQLLHTQHFLGYVSFSPSEEIQQSVSESSELRVRFNDALVLGEGTGRNMYLTINYIGQVPLLACYVSPSPTSSIVVYSSQHVSLHSGEEVLLPVSVQTPQDVSSSRNLNFFLDCEGYHHEEVFPFSLIEDSTVPIAATGLAVGDTTQTKLSFFGFVVVGILVVVFVARLFHKKDTQKYVSLGRPQRTLIPLDLS